MPMTFMYLIDVCDSMATLETSVNRARSCPALEGLAEVGHLGLLWDFAPFCICTLIPRSHVFISSSK